MAISFPVAPIQQERSDSSSTFKTLLLLIALVMIVVLAIMPADAHAQTTTGSSGASGDALWAQGKATLFSGWGMLISLIIIAIGVFVWMRRGIGEGLIVMVAGFLIFMGPALVTGARNAGQALATASVDVISPSNSLV